MFPVTVAKLVNDMNILYNFHISSFVLVVKPGKSKLLDPFADIV